MIGISMQTYDVIGARAFRDVNLASDAANRSGSRRIMRTATLDGGVSVYDAGYTDSDRTLFLKYPSAPQDVVDYARYIVETYGLVVVTTDDGAYSAVPESYTVGTDGGLTVKLTVKERLSE